MVLPRFFSVSPNQVIVSRSTRLGGVANASRFLGPAELGHAIARIGEVFTWAARRCETCLQLTCSRMMAAFLVSAKPLCLLCLERGLVARVIRARTESVASPWAA